MTTNKGVNRTFLITFLIYVGGSFLWSLIGKRFVDSFYVDIAVSQLLVCVPPFVYLKISGTKTGELIPYKKIRISDALLAVVMTYLFYPLMLVMNLLTMFFVDNTSAELATTMGQENLFLNILFVGIAASLCGGVCVPRSLLSDLPEEQHEGSTGAQRTSVRLYAHEL